jgi:hypothetical protein
LDNGTSLILAVRLVPVEVWLLKTRILGLISKSVRSFLLIKPIKCNCHFTGFINLFYSPQEMALTGQASMASWICSLLAS